jgi:fatty acid desaturase
VDLFRTIILKIKRIIGIKDQMMRDHCSDKDIASIRMESLVILLFHFAVIALAIIYKRWEPIVFITMAHFIGLPTESFWHFTEHIGCLYNTNDFRLSTRSIKVGWFIHLIYGGLDDHVDHHLYPVVPSRNLPRLHKLLKKDLPVTTNVLTCWKEMFAIAREKDKNPDHEYIPEPVSV